MKSSTHASTHGALSATLGRADASRSSLDSLDTGKILDGYSQGSVYGMLYKHAYDDCTTYTRVRLKRRVLRVSETARAGSTIHRPIMIRPSPVLERGLVLVFP